MLSDDRWKFVAELLQLSSSIPSIVSSANSKPNEVEKFLELLGTRMMLISVFCNALSLAGENHCVAMISDSLDGMDVRKFGSYGTDNEQGSSLRQKYSKILPVKSLEKQDPVSRNAENSQSMECAVLSECIVCLSSNPTMTAVPCGHLSICTPCHSSLPNQNQCPMCRQVVTKWVRTFY